MFEVLQHKNLFFVQYYKDVCVVPNSCVYLRFQVFYFLFFRFLPFVSEVFNFRSDKRFQIFFCVPVFDSVFQSRIFSAINNNSFRNFSVSEFRAFRFLFINEMPVQRESSPKNSFIYLLRYRLFKTFNILFTTIFARISIPSSLKCVPSLLRPFESIVRLTE